MPPDTTKASALTQAWSALTAHSQGDHDIRVLFAADPNRAAHFTATLDDLTLDFSKTSLTDQALAELQALAAAAGLEDFRTRLFQGRPVNQTEHRAALHMALRGGRSAGYTADLPGAAPEDASRLAADELDRMAEFVAGVHEGRIRGATGQAFTDVVNIGIGGSDLGPAMATAALTLAAGPRLRAHFLSNVDDIGLAVLARSLDPATTLVLVASKTFTTQETAENAKAARAWMTAGLAQFAPETVVAAHFVALSTNHKAVSEFGISPDRVFGFRDWVGGRFSLWSPVGLSVALAAGWPQFQAMLDGAAAMDRHFRETPWPRNLPALLAMVEVWHVDVVGTRAHCVLAYDDRLARFPAYLQQLEMESNGKSTGLDGHPVAHATCPVVFGEPGTNAQHSFMQLVHQGTQPVPVDFILAARPPELSTELPNARPEAHRILAAHAFAQAEALLRGKTLAEATAEMAAAGADPTEIAAIAPHRVFSGNRPSVTLLFEQLDGFALGRLIALYEHKVAVLGCLWGINSFDQWGVELGKALAGKLLPDLQPSAASGKHDASTQSLIARFRALRGET